MYYLTEDFEAKEIVNLKKRKKNVLFLETSPDPKADPMPCRYFKCNPYNIPLKFLRLIEGPWGIDEILPIQHLNHSPDLPATHKEVVTLHKSLKIEIFGTGTKEVDYRRRLGAYYQKNPVVPVWGGGEQLDILELRKLDPTEKSTPPSRDVLRLEGEATGKDDETEVPTNIENAWGIRVPGKYPSELKIDVPTSKEKENEKKAKEKAAKDEAKAEKEKALKKQKEADEAAFEALEYRVVGDNRNDIIVALLQYILIATSSEALKHARAVWASLVSPTDDITMTAADADCSKIEIKALSKKLLTLLKALVTNSAGAYKIGNDTAMKHFLVYLKRTANAKN